MPRIVKLSELNKKDRKKIEEQTQKEVAERKANIQNEISFVSKNESRIPTNTQNNVMSNMPLPVRTNRVQNYNTINNFSNAFEQFNFKNRSNSTNPKYYGKGNIDLNNRKILRNKDGSISTEQSMSFGDEYGNEILVPTIINGKKVSDNEAIDHYYKTGEHLGKFKSVKEAEEYAQALHNRQDRFYNSNVGEIQKSTSQKVFETLNPGKKLSYTNKNESKFDNNFLTKQAIPLASDVGTTVASILKSNNINNNLNNNKFVSGLDKTIKTGFLSGIGSFESGMINAGALPIGEAQKALGKITGIKSLEDRGNISESIGKAINNASQYGSRTNSMIDNDFVKTAGQVSEGIGNMAVPIAVNVATGGEGGNLLQAISAGGNKAISTLNEENSNPIRSALSGGAMGGIEYYTNKLFGGNILAKGSLDDIAGNAIKKIPNKVGQFLANKGYAVGGEIIEENLSNIGEYIVDKIINNKDMPSLKQWFSDAKETTKTTALTTMVLDILGFGGADLTQNTEQDIEMNKWINEAEKIVKQNIEQDIQRIDQQDIQQSQAKQDITERINNSNLSEEDKTNMLDYVQNEDFTQADYNAMRETIDVANNQKTLYNNNESESDLNARTGNTNGIQESTLGSEEKNAFSNDRYKQEETAIRKQGEVEYTDNDKSFADKLINKYNKKAFIYDDTNASYGGGLSYIDNNTIMFGKNALNDYGYDFLEGHEILEDINKNHKDVSEKVINNLKEKLQKDEGFGDVFLKYIADMKDDVYQYYIDKPELVAKEIIGDLNGLRNAGIDYSTLDNYKALNKNLVKEIQEEVLNLENKIYNNKNSNQSSFIMPTAENINKEEKRIAPYRTEEQIAKDTSISDIDAIKEASQQVETSTLPVAEQKENNLKTESIDRSPTIDYIKKKRSKEKLSVKEIKDTLVQKIVNKGHYIDKLAKQTKNNKLTHLYDRIMNTFNEAQISIGDNQINSKGEVVGKSLIDVFQPSVDAGLETKFEDYLLNLHNIDRYAHEKGIYGEEISASDSRKIADQYEKDYPIFKEWKEDVYKYNDNNLKDLVNNGLVSQDTYDKLKSLYGNYIPTFRDIVDNVSEYLDDTVGNNPLKRATQSDRDILSVKEAMAEQTLMQKKAIRMNNLGLELYKTLGKDSTVLEGIQVDPIAMQTLSGDVIEKATDGSNIYTIFDNGEMKQFKISDELYSAFSKDTLQNRINNSKTAKAILTPIEKMSKAQRELLTTYSVGFAMNNPIKDFQDALFNTKYSGTRFVKNWTKALYNIGTKGSWYENYKNNGGTANTYFDYSKGLLPTKTKNPIKKFANAIKSVNEVLEQAPRLAEYISTIETGGSVDEALYNASEVTTNFKRGGDITKAVNKYGVNFLNASVQGLDKAYRNITGQNGVKGYANLLTKATLYQIAPAILNGIIFRDDKDYEDLPEYTKDNYFLFKMGDGKFFRIPKGRVSAVIGGIARRSLETAEGKDVDWKSLIDTTINQLAPNNPLTDNIVAPIKQAVDNKSWYGGDIVSTRLQKLPVAEQSDETTDKLSKAIGERLNKSPKKINYVLDQYSGGIGDVILPMLTPQAENNILEDKFTTDAVIKNKNVSKYYNTLEELQKQNNSSKATDKDKLKYKYISSTSKDMSNLYTQKREIQNSNLSDKDKKEKVREIQKQINNLAEDTLKGLEDKVEIKENTANVNGIKYYKENGEWKKVSDKDIKKSKNISLTTYSDYKNKISKLSDDEEKIKTADKIQILLDSKYSDKEKKEIYINYINKNDNLYNTINKTGINIDEYLKYKTQNFESDRKKDGTLQGKSKRNKKDKVVKYLNSMDITGNQRLLLYAIQGYKTDNSQKNQLVKYVKSLDLDNKEKLQLLNKFSGFKVYKNGTIKY